MRELEVIGSDVRNFACPRCGSTDRERHLFLYFDKLDLWEKVQGGRILHVAPERHLARGLAASGPEIHLRADLVPSSSVSVAFNLAYIPLPDGSIDFVVANHVLEHVDDITGALRELVRIMRPGALAVLQTPFSPLLDETLELAPIRSDETRQLLYGQEDHVRLFGRDIVQQVEDCGLQSRLVDHDSLGCDASRFGVNQREPLLLFEKPGGMHS